MTSDSAEVAHWLNVTVRFGSRVVLDGFSATVEAGSVLGLIGANGAGKTTALRVLLGLISPTEGMARVSSHRSMVGGPRALGFLLEEPALDASITGRKNLRYLLAHSGTREAAVGEAFSEIGLDQSADRLVRKYSLGMKQRLAIAAAIADSPQLVVLDEPANGLDPFGIRDVRNQILRLRKAGSAVVVSSHLLGEMEEVCDKIVLLNAGKTVASGTIQEIRSLVQNTWLVAVHDVDKSAEVLQYCGEIIDVGKDYVTVRTSVGGSEMLRLLTGNEIYPESISRSGRGLEDVFFQLARDGQR